MRLGTIESTAFELPTDFEQRSAIMCARLQAGESMTVEYLASQLGVSCDFIGVALAVLFRAVANSVPALTDLSSTRPLH